MISYYNRYSTAISNAKKNNDIRKIKNIEEQHNKLNKYGRIEQPSVISVSYKDNFYNFLAKYKTYNDMRNDINNGNKIMLDKFEKFVKAILKLINPNYDIKRPVDFAIIDNEIVKINGTLSNINNDLKLANISKEIIKKYIEQSKEGHIVNIKEYAKEYINKNNSEYANKLDQILEIINNPYYFHDKYIKTLTEWNNFVYDLFSNYVILMKLLIQKTLDGSIKYNLNISRRKRKSNDQFECKETGGSLIFLYFAIPARVPLLLKEYTKIFGESKEFKQLNENIHVYNNAKIKFDEYFNKPINKENQEKYIELKNKFQDMY